jgi:hypothetical protein
MIAVINNKKGDEDVLTGHFFGTIRYTSSFGVVLGKLLREAIFSSREEKDRFLNLLENSKNYRFENSVKIHFWKHKWEKSRKEPDLVIEFDNAVILIEVKLNNGLSGDEQLSDYVEILEIDYKHKAQFLLVLAQFPKSKEIYDKSKASIQGLKGFGYLSWQKFSNTLQDLKGDFPDSQIIADLRDYLAAKKLDSFINFEFKDMNTEQAKREIPKAFALVRKAQSLSLKFLRDLDSDFDSYERLKVEDTNNSHNYMTWRHYNDVWGMATYTFQKPFKHKDYNNRLFTVSIVWCGFMGSEEPKLVLSIYLLKSEPFPTKFTANEGWIYDRAWNENLRQEIKNSIYKSNPSPDHEAHKRLDSTYFKAFDLLDITTENLKITVSNGFNEILALVE